MGGEPFSRFIFTGFLFKNYYTFIIHGRRLDIFHLLFYCGLKSIIFCFLSYNKINWIISKHWFEYCCCSKMRLHQYFIGSNWISISKVRSFFATKSPPKLCNFPRSCHLPLELSSKNPSQFEVLVSVWKNENWFPFRSF